MKSWTGLNHGISLDIPRLGKRRAEVPQLAKDLIFIPLEFLTQLRKLEKKYIPGRKVIDIWIRSPPNNILKTSTGLILRSSCKYIRQDYYLVVYQLHVHCQESSVLYENHMMTAQIYIELLEIGHFGSASRHCRSPTDGGSCLMVLFAVICPWRLKPNSFIGLKSLTAIRQDPPSPPAVDVVR
ncbi:hypothetical protein P167DRAFT_549162 [Morchella conica CCBAS932]|uniref:Uncharacterized protein n=1 Tax=Morchella conica CCBAS932 TaxID=1392247 RepID=A0A3N4KCA4_9PEZI|nr:hypothetical protein P167DRAFT_549162 [Morchella conica CCBAS932]